MDDTIAGRVELTPWEPTRGLAAAPAVRRSTSRAVKSTTGCSGCAGRTVDGFTFFEPVYVSGRRLRLGVDGLWTPGPFSVAG